MSFPPYDDPERPTRRPPQHRKKMNPWLSLVYLAFLFAILFGFIAGIVWLFS